MPRDNVKPTPGAKPDDDAPTEIFIPPASLPTETTPPIDDLAAAQARIAELEARLASVPPAPAKECPAMGPEGSKTPAVLEWLAEHDPAEFVRRYEKSGGTLIKKLLPIAQARCRTM